MIFPDGIKIYGDPAYRGKCNPESAEQVTFFNHLRHQYPDTYGRIAIHPRNEGNRHYAQTVRYKMEGMTKSASDIIIPGSQTFVCEMKRKNHTLSRWEDGQIEYLEAAKTAGAFVCIALGFEAAWEAFLDWKRSQ